MPLNKYRVFSKIAQTGNMRKAAKEMMYTQQAISRIVKCMEHDLGFALFTRERDGVTLTAQAERILPEVNRLIEQENKLLGVINEVQADEGISKHIRIGACGSIVMGLMHDLLKTMRATNPEVSIAVMYDANNDTTVADLKDGKLDLAIMVEGCHEDMNFDPLFSEHFMAAIPDDHALANQSEISIDELMKYPNVICMDNPYYDELMGNSNHNTVVVDEEIMMLPIVKKEHAVGIVSGVFQYGKDSDIAIKPLKESYCRVIGVASRPNEEKNETTAQVINTIKDIVDRAYKEGMNVHLPDVKQDMVKCS